MKYLWNRIKEPSSWAGLAAIATVFGVPQGTVQAITAAVVAVAGAVAVILPEKS